MTSYVTANKIPYTLLYGKKPDLSYFRVWGCTAYVHIQKDKRNKGHSPHSQKCVFIGYPPDYKGWKCYNPVTKQILISNSVQFDERYFPGLSITALNKVPDTFTPPSNTTPSQSTSPPSSPPTPGPYPEMFGDDSDSDDEDDDTPGPSDRSKQVGVKQSNTDVKPHPPIPGHHPSPTLPTAPSGSASGPSSDIKDEPFACCL